jgi:choline dehydrogenase-like flavoprotein
MSCPNDQGLWFNSYASNFANPFFHWCGSIRMKQRSIHYPELVDENDKDYVLENDLRVRNTTNVNVCCASAFPNPISVPTALTCAALGFVLVTRILNPTSSTIKQGMKEKGD